MRVTKNAIVSATPKRSTSRGMAEQANATQGWRRFARFFVVAPRQLRCGPQTSSWRSHASSRSKLGTSKPARRRPTSSSLGRCAPPSSTSQGSTESWRWAGHGRSRWLHRRLPPTETGIRIGWRRSDQDRQRSSADRGVSARQGRGVAGGSGGSVTARSVVRMSTKSDQRKRWT